MLRRRENNDEIQMLKSQISELKDDLRRLKSSIKSDIHKSYGDYSIGSSIGKTLGKALFKGFTQADYNKQLISQFYKFSSRSIHSFGDDNKNEF